MLYGRSQDRFRNWLSSADCLAIWNTRAPQARSSPSDRENQRGAITIAESLIVIAIGVLIFATWAQVQGQKQSMEKARLSGRHIAAYAEAASVMLAENPPAAESEYDVDDLQNCDDSSARQYLPCTYGATTDIPFVTDSDGNKVSFADLRIEVTITPDGPAGIIDIGEFRHGDDENGDGLPDTRPDLAAAALNEANEKQSAGVLGYYSIHFKRDDVSDVEFDLEADGFDQTAIDELASLEAHIGATSNNAPFLRLDGANKMTGAITFANQMSIAPIGEGLTFSGSGDLSVESGNIVAANHIEADSIEVTSATVDKTLAVNAALGATGAGFSHLDQSKDIDQLLDEIIRINEDVMVLTGASNTNVVQIEQNAARISTNLASIEEDRRRLTANEEEIDTNSDVIKENAAAISALKNRPDNPPESCYPSRSQLLQMYRNTYRYNESSSACWRDNSYCEDIVRYPRGGYTKYYKYKQGNTQNCLIATLKFYDSCRLERNDDCIR